MPLFSRRLPHVLTDRDLVLLLAPTYAAARGVDEEEAMERLRRAVAAPGVLEDLYRGISAVTVTSSPPGTTYVAGTDYEVDAQEGRIYIVPGGGIASGANILVDYTYETQSKSTVKGGAVSSIKALIRYVSNNPTSPESSCFVWRASIKGSGAVGFLSDNYASFQVTGKLEADPVNHPNDPYYLLIKR